MYGRTKRYRLWAGGLGALALLLAACGSSAGAKGGGGGGNPGASGGKAIKIGLMTSLTGPLASTFDGAQAAVKARIALQNKAGGVDGHKLEFVTVDDASTGPGAQAAVKKLIQQDKVYAILSVSAFGVAVVPAVRQAGTPYFGISIVDGGTEWFNKSDKNFFDAYGYGSFDHYSSATGKYFKSIGATRVAAVGTNGPSSKDAALEAIASSQAAGLKKAYLNTSLAFGATDVGPIIQQIKASGADAAVLTVSQNTAFALITGLQQAGVHLKSVLLSTGYGQTVIDSPASRAAAQNVDFTLLPAPAEDDNPGTQKLVSALKTYNQYTGVPSFGMYLGWLSTDLFVSGLQKAGAGASQSKYVETLRKSTWDGADGLEAPINFADVKQVGGNKDQKGCFYIVRLKGTKFVPQPTANPVCGTNIPK